MPAIKIQSITIRQVNLSPKVVRTDAIQSFVTQETVLLTLHCSDGIDATGYAYTIGTGGSSVIALLKDHLAPRLIGRSPLEIEAIWKDLFYFTHATAVGAITSGQLNLDFILDERARELYWEGHRRTDLIRFGKFTGAGYLWDWKGKVKAGTGTESFRDLFPIPSTELGANPNLKQNTGY